MEKLSFSIDTAELVNDELDPNFSILTLDFFASGKNKHDMFVSDETLERTAQTIKNKPIVWVYNKMLDDLGSHDILEVPAGFVPEKSKINFKKLPDGRIMLQTVAYVWRKYSGKFLEFFKRDGEKPVSVEMSVYNSKVREDGLTELLDYVFEAITVLGSNVKPAIPNSCASVLQFAIDEKKEYDHALLEFSNKYNSIDFKIPESIKRNAEKGLELYKQHGIGGNSVALSVARHIGKNDFISPEKVKTAFKFLKSHKNDNRDNKSPNKEFIAWMLHGGDESFAWYEKTCSSMEEIDNRKLSYFESKIVTFPYDSLKDANPSIRGIDPPVTLGQANEIARQADAIGADNHGWPTAISSFKKRHKVVDGHWVKKDSNEESSTNMGFEQSQKEELKLMNDEEKKEEEMAVEEKESPKDEKKEEEKETPEQEKEETKEEEKKEKEEGTEKKMSLDSNLDVAAILAMLEDETEDYRALVDSHKSGVDMNYSVLCSKMFAKMTKMAEEIKKNKEDKDAYMSEVMSLKEFKANVDAEKFNYEVETTLNAVSDSMPKNEVEKARDDSKNFSIETVDAWKNSVKAMAFSFEKEKKKSDGITRIGFPFGNTETKKANGSPWNR